MDWSSNGRETKSAVMSVLEDREHMIPKIRHDTNSVSYERNVPSICDVPPIPSPFMNLLAIHLALTSSSQVL